MNKENGQQLIVSSVNGKRMKKFKKYLTIMLNEKPFFVVYEDDAGNAMNIVRLLLKSDDFKNIIKKKNGVFNTEFIENIKFDWTQQEVGLFIVSSIKEHQRLQFKSLQYKKKNGMRLIGLVVDGQQSFTTAKTISESASIKNLLTEGLK